MTDPTPNEVRQAALLARGLEHGVGQDWSKVDPDVQESVFALRPELAPAPREGLLEEALEEVMEGPFAVEPTPEELADSAAFAALLDQPDARFSNDLESTVFALAPERAPAPRVGIDEILDGVSTGPFAPVIQITGEFPAEIAPPSALGARRTSTPQVVSLAARRAAAPAPAPAPPSRRPSWYVPALGAFAAAAATLLFVVPGVSMHEAAPMPPLEGAPQISEPAASVPAADSAAPSRVSQEAKRKKSPAKKSAPSRAAAPMPAPEPEPEPERAAVEGPTASASPGDALTDDAPNDAEPSEQRESTMREAMDAVASKALQADDDIGAVAAGGGASSSSDVFDGDLSAAQDAMAETLQLASDEPQPPPFASAFQEEDLEATIASSGAPAPEASDSAAHPPAARRATEVKSKTVERSEPGRPRPRSAGATSTSARDLGLIDASLVRRRPDLVPFWQLAADLEQRGDHFGAAQALRTLCDRESDPDVVVDAAVRSGRLYLQIGALQKAKESLAHARQHTPKSAVLISARASFATQIEAYDSRK